MWLQFLLENFHFSLNLLTGLVFLGVAWLHLDAWLERRTSKEGLRVLGFLLLSVSFIIHATYIESLVFDASLFIPDLNNLLLLFTRLPGYLFILISLLLDPLQAQPKVEESPIKRMLGQAVLISSPLSLVLSFLYPVFALCIAFLYARKAYQGLEAHLKPVALSFGLLAFSEFFSLTSFFQTTDNVNLYHLTAVFGPAWILTNAFLLLAILILGKWVFGYLVKRIQSQLWMIYTVTVVTIFLLTTVTFTGLLLKQIQDGTLKQLNTDVRVLEFVLDSKKEEALSDAWVIAKDPLIHQAIAEKDREQLNQLLREFLLTKGESFLLVVDDNGQVLARGEDKERYGESLANDPIIKRALLGENLKSVSVKDGVMAPLVSIQAALPIKKDGVLLGAIMTGSLVDNTFLDGVKKATGLEASIYGVNTLSATTLLGTDGKTRPIGLVEKEEDINEIVLNKGESLAKDYELLNRPYLASFVPLKDVDNEPVGMLFVGREQKEIIQAAGRSIEITFIVAVVLLVISAIPSFLVANYVSRQIR